MKVFFALCRAKWYALNHECIYQQIHVGGTVVFIGILKTTNVEGVAVKQIEKSYYVDRDTLHTLGYGESHFKVGYIIEGLKDGITTKRFKA